MLAEALGCTVDELLNRISSAELTEWIAYYKIREDERKKAEREAKQKLKSKHK